MGKYISEFSLYEGQYVMIIAKSMFNVYNKDKDENRFIDFADYVLDKMPSHKIENWAIRVLERDYSPIYNKLCKDILKPNNRNKVRGLRNKFSHRTLLKGTVHKDYFTVMSFMKNKKEKEYITTIGKNDCNETLDLMIKMSDSLSELLIQAKIS